MKIVLASRNKKKIAELDELLGLCIPGIEILSLDDAGIYTEIEENGETFAENALIKARAAAESGYIGVGDDSGLSVYALNGAPGVYSARYAGEHGNDSLNNSLLLKNLENKADRSAAFVCTVACVFPDGSREPVVCEGRVEGKIINEYRGANGFGYDPLFLYEPAGKTFAEMTADEKNAISHRGQAIRKLARILADIDCKKFN